MFLGYPENIQSFFQALYDDNSKEWFTANRMRFDDEVIEPSVHLIAALAKPLSQLAPELRAEPKVNKSIRRIFRDTRFSKDKTPYHDHLHLVFWAGDHPNRSAGVHVIIGKNGFGFGAGHWGFEESQLANYRQSVLLDGGAQISRVIDIVTAKGLTLDAPALKRVPRGFDANVNGANWLRYKGLVVKSGDGPIPKELFGPEGVEYIANLCRDMQPLMRYLVENVYS